MLSAKTLMARAPALVLLLILFISFDIKAQLPDQFQKVELIQGLRNSVNFEFSPDGRIFIIDRYGEIIIYDPNSLTSTSAGVLPVFHELEDGLLGIEFDPNFLSNNYIYLHYSPVTPSVNRVSRFTMIGNQLDQSSEVVLMEWATQRDICCHAAGDLDFDSQGNLYIATGDNTNHSKYATLDETDSNKSSENTASNTNDLRGKILRITPQPNGSYTIPNGNLFPGGVGGLPEIYVMGARNPYRIYVDRENTDWLFWGEVGPDANQPGVEGPEGLDEINLTKNAGNFGWPYLSGDNQPYRNDYVSEPFYYDPQAPVNLSQWNTGATDLPAAEPAWMSFFHECYLAGPRYYYDASILDPKKLPIEFDEAFFYFDFNTSRVWVVQMDAQGNILSNDRLAPAILNINKNGFIDMKIGPDGHLYVLEYGEGCCPDNVGSGKLVRLDYTGIVSNSSPVVSLAADPNNGSLPLLVNFSSEGTFDPDGDPLTYQWDFDGNGTVDSNEENPTFSYTAAGQFEAQLTVSDDEGGISAKTITIYAGNNAASFEFISPPDGGFFGWNDDVDIEVSATDVEDGTIPCTSIDLLPSLGHLNHFHDDLSIDGCAKTLTLDPLDHDTDGEMDIFYVMGVNYTDQGGLTSFDQIRLHPKRKEAEYYDLQNDIVVVSNTDTWDGGPSAVRVNDNSYLVFEGRNLSGINSVKYRVASAGSGGEIELRLDGPTGTLVNSTTINPTGGWNSWTTVESNLTDPGGKHDLYFVFKSTPGAKDLFSLNWVEFGGNGISTDNTPPTVNEVTVLNETSISIEFSEPVTSMSSESIGSYQIDGGVLISAAELQDDNRTVVLTTTTLSPSVEYIVFINGVQNLAGLDIAPGNYTFRLFDSIRINAGGPQITANGVTFSADQHANGGELFDNDVTIGGTSSQALYQTERWGDFTYNIPVANQGTYDIRLHFSEIYFGVDVNGGIGSRVFNVSIEGNQVLSNFDILTEVPVATALTKEFNDIAISDGMATIQFTSLVENAKISAIEILDPNTFDATPNITILSPSDGASVGQPFSIGFRVENWEVEEGSTHMHYFIDGEMVGPHYSLNPLTIDGLSTGIHTIRLELFEASHTGTGIFDEVTVNVTDQVACTDTEFPNQWEEHLIDDALPYRSVYILPQQDIDGDGLKDIVTGGWWYKNPGSAGGNWVQSTIGSPFNNVAWIYDFDGDGDQDLFGSQGAYESPELVWAENDGSGNFTVHTNIPAGTTSYTEIFIAGVAGAVYQQNGPYQLALTWNGAENGSSQVQMLTVPADPVNQNWTIENIHPNSLGEGLTAGDIDGDGDLDLFQAGNWLRNDQGSWQVFSTGITYTSTFDRNALADFDRDGDLDGVAGQLLNNREIAWFEAPEDPTQLWTKHQIHPSIDGSLSVGVADMDFDGDADIIVGEWRGANKLFGFENDLCASGEWITHVIDPGGNGLDHHDGSQLVDIDDDGDLDIITIGWDNITPRIFENLSDPVVQNLPPVLTTPSNQSYQAGATVNLQISGADPNPGDVLTYSATGLPEGLGIDGGSGLISGVLTAVPGDYQVTVRLTDQEGLFDQKVFTITVGGAGNTAPVITNPGNQEYSGGNFEIQVQATDADAGDVLSYNATGLPAGLTINENSGLINGIITAPAGDYSVTVVVTDQGGLSDEAQFIITVLGSGNLAPSLTNPGDQTYNGGMVNLLIEAIDLNSGDLLTFTATGLPSGLTIDQTSGLISGNLSAQPGNYDVTVRVTDQDGLFDEASFTITITDFESLLRINSGGSAFTFDSQEWIADAYFTGGADFSTSSAISGTANQQLYQTERYAEGGTMTYEIPISEGEYQVQLHFAEIFYTNAGQRVFNVNVEGGQGQLSNYDIFIAAGGANKAVIETFTVNVTDGGLTITFNSITEFAKISGIEVNAAGNVAPILLNPGNQQYNSGNTVNLQLEGSDLNSGDVITYSASGLPTGLIINSTTGLISGTLAAAIGDYNVTARVSDQSGLFDEETFIITVTDFNSLLRINSGGPNFTFNNEDWMADQYFTGGLTFSTESAIAGTSNDQLYQTERYADTGIMSYAIPLSDGDYQVRLHFAEIFHNKAGARVFDVDIESGQAGLDDYDIYQEAGGANTAVVEDFLVSVNDGFLNIDFTSEIELAKVSGIEISGAGNVAPVVVNPGNQQYSTGAMVNLQLEGTDLNPGDLLTYSAQGLPAGLTINPSSGLISGTISAAVGNYSVTVRVTDQQGLFDEESFTMVVQDFNSMLRINSGGQSFNFNGEEWVADQYFNGGKTFGKITEIAGTNNDQLYHTERYADGGVMSYAIPLTPGEYQIKLHFAEIFHTSAGARVFDVDIESGQGGLTDYDIFTEAGGANTAVVETFDVGVSDGMLNIDFVSKVELAKISGIEINGLAIDNVAPEIQPISAQVLPEGTSMQLDVISTDLNGEFASLIVDALPSFASFTDNLNGTGALFLNPGYTDVGNYTITVTATDGGGLSDQETIFIEVVEVNVAPELTIETNLSVEEGTSQEIPVTAIDQDGEIPSLSAVNLPSFVSFKDNGDGTGVLIISPNLNDFGSYTFILKGTDAAGSSQEKVISLEVIENTTNPNWVVSAETTNANCLNQNGSIVLAVSGGFGEISYEWSHGEETKDLEDLSAGIYIVTITDEKNNTTTESFIINVQPGPQKPELTQTGELLTTEAIAFSYQWFLDGVEIPGETGQTIEPSLAGEYSLQIADELGCFSISDPFVIEFEESSLSFYPNPTKGTINIELVLVEDEVVTFSIIDELGRSSVLGSFDLKAGHHEIPLELGQSMANGAYTIITNHSDFRNNAYRILLIR